MKVTFENALLCDVVDFTRDNKTFYGCIVYNRDDRQLYYCSLPQNVSIDKIIDLISNMVVCNAEMKTYDGKNKFKLTSIQAA